MYRSLHGRAGASLLKAIASHPREAPALSAAGNIVTYGDLARAVVPLALNLKRISPVTSDDDPARVAFLTPPNPAYVKSLIASWVAGLIAVPLSPLYPPQGLAGIVEDACPGVIVTAPPYGPVYQGIIGALTTLKSVSFQGTYPPHLPINNMIASSITAETFDSRAQDELSGIADEIPRSRPAMIIYTSGTTGVPKGVVWTHEMVDYQVATMADQWRWSKADRILNVLPLHHIHGLVNVLLTSLYAGAQCTMMEKFKPQDVWKTIMSPSTAPTVFMAVPTIYQRLIRYYNESSDNDRAAMRSAASSLRLYVCGSAALGSADYDAWRDISGHSILERYGMTEAGMILSNPYNDRSRACLGVPLPGVEVSVTQDDSNFGDCAVDSFKYTSGELLVRGPGVFPKYWRRPRETSESFTSDGWFRTGDIVRMEKASKKCFMIGRTSTDVIKSGGYKISALEIEDILGQCPLVSSSAVLGIDDDELGMCIVCCVIPREDTTDLPDKIRVWLSERLPMYKVPRDIRVFREFPRNTMGKVQKQILVSNWATSAPKPRS
jgi:malonyl-CoA/methylmalonyl-CoA synthetase